GAPPPHADAVLGCLDSRHARLSLLGRCARAGAPLIDGGTHPWGGEVRVRLSPDEACYCCSLTPGQRAEADAPLSCDPAGAPQPASIISTALVAGWMTTAATQLLLGRPVGWRFLQIEALSGRTAPITVRRDDGCGFHRRPDFVDQLKLGGSATVRELLATLPEDSEPLVWSMFPVPGICYHCGHESVPASIRGGSLVGCPNCREIVHLDLTQRLREAPPDATLSELGVAPEEIIPVRSSSGGYRWLRIAA
ncbi:ThiF family adenylyltransferase, partial [Actinoplanes sp. NPDC005259]|uniref:ThiF family adenylyltransferase n=1 Tax=Actinoplanes sp. NPDC005259 TaxID=3154674 RepID=UPI0033B4A5C3